MDFDDWFVNDDELCWMFVEVDVVCMVWDDVECVCGVCVSVSVEIVVVIDDVVYILGGEFEVMEWEFE